MERFIRRLCVSLSAIALAAALVVAGTFALFTDTVTIKNHLVSGSMSMKLTRTYLEQYILGNDGHMTTVTDDDPADFSGKADEDDAQLENVFGLSGTQKIAPESKLTAVMEISHQGDVAYGYWIELKITQGSYELAQQLSVTLDVEGTSLDVTTDENTVWNAQSTAIVIGGKNAYIGVLDKVNTADTFTVSVEFLDLNNNNSVQDKEVYFDLVVYAVQYVA